ncbi:tRNA 2-selenouridine(34) synthase MnmH [Candidatus Woesearchaeota archaeon]|nr:tRNA 2-selenouridine(34) synthase MnmH [Candidatus Woesearchaeota archaeon]
MVRTIKVEEALKKKEVIFLDTRSPKEFAEDCLPGAISVPIFNNEERAIVGTIYKQVSQEKAVEQGLEFFSKNLPHIIKIINQFKDKELVVYCWRGGMRSKVIVSLLEAMNYRVWQLEGGHKAFRHYVRERLENYVLKPKIVVLWGLTCTGKTELIQQFPQSLDLESFAQHRGSLYGALGLIPSSQKKFDNLFLQRLEDLNNEPYIIVEGESRKIGDVQIPEFFYKAMKNGIAILVKKSIEQRAIYGAKVYLNDKTIEEVKKISAGLQRLISKEKKEELVKLLEKKENVAACRILLDNYYDQLYEHTLNKINFAAEINNETIEQGKEELNGAIRKVFG